MTNPRLPQHPDRRPDARPATAPTTSTKQAPATAPPELLPIADRLIQALEQLVILSDDVARATADYQPVLARQHADTARRAADTHRDRDEDRDRGAPDDRGVERY
jgi:hypothetical protein